MSKTAFMAFMAEAPIVGLDPHPGWAPDEAIESFDAEGYAKALGAYDDRAKIEAEIAADHNAREDAVEAGDMDDCDEADSIFEIEVHDDGRIDVIHDDPRYVFASFTIREVYETFGMTMPANPAG